MKKLTAIAFATALFAVSCSEKTAVKNYDSVFDPEHLSYVAFPIGGMGAGMFCLEGTGAISHMSIRNRPDLFNEPCIFATIHIKGMENGTKVVEGPVPDSKRVGKEDSATGALRTHIRHITH